MTYELYFQNWATVNVPQGMFQCVTYAAKEYHTNFINACIFPFEKRQKYHIKSWLDKQTFSEKNVLWRIICLINGWTCRTPFPDDITNEDLNIILNFVEEEQFCLGIHNNPNAALDIINNNEWRKNHTGKYIK